MLTLQSTQALNHGGPIPMLGLGVFRAAAGTETQEAVTDALALGYRHIDTARIYNNERDVGIAVRASGIPRDQIFITSKLWNSDHGYDSGIRACSESLTRLDTDYMDLYLIHWPVPKVRRDAWRALEKLRADGKCRAIGVSNYTVRHLKELLDSGASAPAVNQVEFSPYLFQSELLEFCQKHKIVLEAYSPLTKGRKLKDPRLVEIAEKYGKTAAQILVRWPLQHGVVVLPKSSRKARIRENANVFDFDISEADMKTLDAMDENFRTSWDPTEEP